MGYPCYLESFPVVICGLNLVIGCLCILFFFHSSAVAFLSFKQFENRYHVWYTQLWKYIKSSCVKTGLVFYQMKSNIYHAFSSIFYCNLSRELHRNLLLGWSWDICDLNSNIIKNTIFDSLWKCSRCSTSKKISGERLILHMVFNSVGKLKPLSICACWSPGLSVWAWKDQYSTLSYVSCVLQHLNGNRGILISLRILH